ncbi:hypothetical protein D9758_000501 [Tetrapyrgos nigripes]|uniref:Low temperature viability protein n=1 Tax=Tetrapyrgos nigripes TaxID=182062 RepID=A0A8H5LZ75_9AGAR|nr:hypothetical protein D9758_000501 [Tetrapyrgos nigripes]
MPPKSKSIFRQPGAKHFQLVHRSQRDPLIHDPDASKHVLKSIVRQNDKKGKSRAELEDLLANEEIAHDQEARVGEASLYGIYYDDTEYDYMQHLRPFGVQEDGVENVLIEAPSKKSQPSGKPKEAKPAGISLRDLPPEALPSTSELPRNYETQQAIPNSISGFQPDMDPHLRQALEALEDDAFVDDDLEDDFFGELVKEGERGSDEEVEFVFYEDGALEDMQDEETDHQGEVEDDTWEARFAQFKKSQKAVPREPNSDDDFSEGGDTVSGLPQISVIGGKGKRRRKGSSEASGYSMSSSSMYRNEALQTLDERFDQLMFKEYNEDEDDDEELHPSDEEEDEAPQLITSREDFTAMMDEFLNDYEILGRKMKPKLEGETGAQKLDTLRTAMGLDQRVRDTTGESEDEEEDIFVEEDDKRDRWDCETILTTYSNLENHPRLIRARDSKPVSKIRLDPKTGLPSIAEDPSKVKPLTKSGVSFKNESDDSDYENDDSHRAPSTVTRSRDETPEEKKARKAAVKSQQAARRAEKKSTKEAFDKELKAAKVYASRKGPTGMKKL